MTIALLYNKLRITSTSIFIPFILLLWMIPDAILWSQQNQYPFHHWLLGRMNYLLYLPDDSGKHTGEKLPLLIFLHGSGESGDDIELVKKNGPPHLINEGAKFTFAVLSPQSPEDRRWQIRKLNLLISLVMKKYNIDEDRIYLSGLSMGGYGAWSYVERYPDRVAAIAPVCGAGNPGKAVKIAHIPAWIFHGEKDPVVPVKHARKMYEALMKAKGDVRITIYPEAGHDSWTETYANKELYDWLLSKKKQKRISPSE